MLVVKYKDKTVEGYNVKSFSLNDDSINYVEFDNPYSSDVYLKTVDSIIVDGVELYKCPKEL